MSEIKRGMDGDAVRHIQEWLFLHEFRTVIDGVFGPATEASLKEFQAHADLYPSGVCDGQTWLALASPLDRARAIRPAQGWPFPALIADTARQHLAQHPREVGGQNMGPWVRYYTRGNEGPDWPWCAGFVSTVVYQAFARAGISPQKFKFSLSCDNLMEYAKSVGTVIEKPVPGCIFLVRGKRPGDWVHTGIVIAYGAEAGVIRTIEGNTNDEGSREGYEACERVRAAVDKDYVLITA
ncbi:MAG: peptidoglycan-binding protein [Syntrophaceae bacterium]